MDQENIVAGVTPGGFQNVYEVRILICYLLSAVKQPLSKEQINFIFQSDHLVNYFTFSSALSQLVAEGHVTIAENQSEERYILTSLGQDVAKMLQNSLPRSVRDNVVLTAMELLARQKKERENEVFIRQTDQGYEVEFIIHDTDFDLMHFTLFVPDQMQAEIIRKKFLKDPTAFYQKIVHFLTET